MIFFYLESKNVTSFDDQVPVFPPAEEIEINRRHLLVLEKRVIFLVMISIKKLISAVMDRSTFDYKIDCKEYQFGNLTCLCIKSVIVLKFTVLKI